MCQSCSGAGPVASTPGRPATTVGSTRPIAATVQPGFETSIAIRIVPATTLFPVEEGGCRPRGDLGYTPPRPVLSDDLVATLTESSGLVTAWLAKQAAHAQLFVDDPVAALQQAGVDLSRAQAKELTASHAAVKADAVLPPGGRLTDLSVTAVRRGKVGDTRPGRPIPPVETPVPGTTDPTRPEQPTGGAGDCGC